MLPTPTTALGFVVPIPTLPTDVMRSFSPDSFPNIISELKVPAGLLSPVPNCI